MTETVAFDPGIGNYVLNLYAEAYVIEDNIARIPVFSRKSRYYSVACKNLVKAFTNNLAFFKKVDTFINCSSL